MDETSFFDTFMPHGMCYLWHPPILLLNVISDGFIAVAYFCIPIALYYFFKNRRDFPFRNVILMFSVFIFTCGLSHLMGIWTIWNGAYGVQGIVKGATAVASVATAIMLIPVMPQLLALRSPKELETANVELALEVEARTKSEAQTHRFIESAPDAIIIVDSENRIVVVNEQAERTFGLNRAELVGGTIEDIIANPTELIHKTVSSDQTKTIHQAILECVGNRNDGTEFPVEISLSPVGTEEQKLTSFAIRDISERRELENQTRWLEQQIAHVDRLDTMGQLAAGLAHEINQPLTALSQNAETAVYLAQQNRDVDPDLLEILQDVSAQALRAGEIIRALRQFVGNDDSQHEIFDLNELFDQTLRLVVSDAKKYGIEIVVNAPDGATAFGVPVQIAQVFVNLLRNSIEALAEAKTLSPQVFINVEQQEDMMRLVFEDNGPGMKGNDHSITPFLSTKQDGMGLGLSICESIIEAHSGSHSIDQSTKGGARFEFTIPAGNYV